MVATCNPVLELLSLAGQAYSLTMPEQGATPPLIPARRTLCRGRRGAPASWEPGWGPLRQGLRQHWRVATAASWPHHESRVWEGIRGLLPVLERHRGRRPDRGGQHPWFNPWLNSRRPSRASANGRPVPGVRCTSLTVLQPAEVRDIKTLPRVGCLRDPGAHRWETEWSPR